MSRKGHAIFGRVFPDPLTGCTPGVGVCSRNAQGNVPATQFIQWQELLDGLRYLNSKDGWNDSLEVLVLDGRLGAGSGSTAGPAMFPGNDGVPLEFTPRPEYVSAGLPTTTLERKKSDLIVVRVTNESVRDKRGRSGRARRARRAREGASPVLRGHTQPAAPFPRIQNEANIRLLAGDLIDDATIVASLTAMRAELDELEQLVAEGEAVMPNVPHRARYLRLSFSLARRLIKTHREWLDEIEDELG